MAEVKDTAKCNCGAITVYMDNGSDVSMRPKLYRTTFPERKGKHMTLNKFYQCNHCVNHWGIDLCNCGSGKHPDKCCKIPAQELGIKKPFVGWLR